jgi:hypothetical protein
MNGFFIFLLGDIFSLSLACPYSDFCLLSNSLSCLFGRAGPIDKNANNQSHLVAIIGG